MTRMRKPTVELREFLLVPDDDMVAETRWCLVTPEGHRLYYKEKHKAYTFIDDYYKQKERMSYKRLA